MNSEIMVNGEWLMVNALRAGDLVLRSAEALRVLWCCASRGCSGALVLRSNGEL